ncbi:MAG: hypothetical protein AAB408_01750 [Patescibacteria group bacterium]
MKILSRTTCPHCSYRKVNHTANKINEIGETALSLLLFQKHFRKLVFLLGDMGIALLLRLALTLGLYRRAPNFERRKILGRSLVLLDEAKNQGLDLIPLTDRRGVFTDHFILCLPNREYLFESLPTNPKKKAIDIQTIDDKYLTKRLLMKHGLPHSPGNTFLAKWRGLTYGQKLGYPLVVKPRHGSQSSHVTMNINDEASLARAIDMVKIYKEWYMVERYIPGDVHRITVIGNSLFAVKRLPPIIIGDGVRTIKELIDAKNQHPLRGNPRTPSQTLCWIPFDELLTTRLTEMGYTLDSILLKDQQLQLNEKINLSGGADIEDVTDQIHPTNQAVFLRLAKLFNTDILGIDYISSGISRPWHEIPSAIIECNTIPSIDLHHFPSIGSPQNAAKEVLTLLRNS